MRWTAFALVVSLFAFVGGLLTAPADLTVPAPPQSAVLLAADGQFFATIRAPEVRNDVKSEDIPLVMRQAIVASEDARFLDHSGVDPLAVLRAAYADIRAKGVTQGGSTITQQYVKNVYVGRERTALRKVREAALAYRLERQMSKDEILTAYLNGVFLGNGVTGVEAAARYYFGIPARRLSLGQAALLAGIVPAPSVRNPVRNMAFARRYQGEVLNRMVRLGMVTASQASEAFAEEPRIVRFRAPELPTSAPEYADLVKDALLDDVGEDGIFRGGLRVRTALDLTLQQAATATLAEILPEPDDPDAAMAVIDPRNGDIKAVVSSRYVRGGLNLASNGQRPTGSAMKPFALIAAFESGKTPEAVYAAPRCLRVRGADKPLCNFGGSGGGTRTLRRATEQSVNTVFLKIAQDVTPAKIADAARRTGMVGRIPTEPLTVSMVLGGGVAVTPLSVTHSYATIANGGRKVPLRTVLEVRRGGDPGNALTGDVVRREPERVTGQQVVKESVARTVADVLVGAVERGTGTAARLPGVKVFGKTGTQARNTDVWFVGCTPELCVGTWVGYSKQGNKTITGVAGAREVTGGAIPAKIFSRFFAKAAELRAAAESDLEGSTASPTPRPRVTRRSPTSRPGPGATTAAPAPAPTPTATRSRGGLPTLGSSPEPSSSPTQDPEPSETSEPSPEPTGTRGGLATRGPSP